MPESGSHHHHHHHHHLRVARRKNNRKHNWSRQKRRSLVLLLLPALLFILGWLFLYRQIAIIHSTPSTAAQVEVVSVSPQRLHSHVQAWMPPQLPLVDNNLDETFQINVTTSTTTTTTTRKKTKTPNAQTRRKRRRQGKVAVQPDPQQQQQDHRHHHVIPNILIFTHVVNLLTTTTTHDDVNVTDDQGDDETVALRANVRRTIQLHPGAEVRFFTNEECTSSIRRVMGEGSPLVEFFEHESQGMFKADVCRGAALYETGGLYFDVDLQARMNVWDAISPTTEFVVPRVHAQSKHPGAFFQAFIGVTPRHVIMKRYLELFVDYYQGKLNGEIKGPLGVLLLRRAYDDVVEGDDTNNNNAAAAAALLFNVELWQEVLYSARLFPNVAPPNWGTRRACHFVVVANRKPPFIVPLYSRVKGSRMCGGKESHHQQLRGH